MNVDRLLVKQIAQRAGHTALVDRAGTRRVSFAELDVLIDRAVHGLLGQGVRPGDRIAVIAKNCNEHMVLFLACARAGFIMQSVNWRLAAPELARILEDSTPAVIVFQDRFREVAEEIRPAISRPCAWLDFGGTAGGSLDRILAEDVAISRGVCEPVKASDLLYILYTGGTTGESKGVLHNHAGTVTSIANNTIGEKITRDDVYMLTGQMFHSPLIIALSYLVNGATVVLMNFEPKLAMELISRERVTSFIGITTMINWMMAVENFADHDVASLRHITYGGGPLPSAVIRDAMEKFGCNFIGLFGQTEGNTMTFLDYEHHTAAIAGKNVERLNSCGRAGFLTEIKIIREDGTEIPPGSNEIGEICVMSAANMVGYWNRPDLTAQTIRDGWMHTGDLAFWDDEQFIYIVDRAKDMIISGGENVYSCQVEDALHKHPAVLEAAVIGTPDPAWGEMVTAFVVLKQGQHATEEEIAAVAAKNLASYQKPRRVFFIDQLPKAPSGKILKRELRARHDQQLSAA